MIAGFGLLVLPSGVKSYLYDYRTPQGIKRRITVGQHGAWTADQARDKASDYREIVKHGGDPLGSKRATREAATVANMLNAYLASEFFAWMSEATKKTDTGRIEGHRKPLLGKKHAHLVGKEDVRRAFAAIRDGKTATDVKTGARGRARVRGGPGAAREAIVRLSIIYTGPSVPSSCRREQRTPAAISSWDRLGSVTLSLRAPTITRQCSGPSSGWRPSAASRNRLPMQFGS